MATFNPRGFAKRHRKALLIVVAAFAVYALLGFAVAPWLVKKNAVESVYDVYGAELRIQKVAVNPFVLSMRVDGIEMDDPAGEPLASLDQFFINFQLSSLFRRALTFAEIRFDSPELIVNRYAVGETNLDFLLQDAGPEEESAASDGDAMPRLIVHNFAVNEAALQWHDAVPREAVSTTFGPVNVQVSDLSTLPQREGQQEVVITTETAGTFSWSGTLQLNPLYSSGRASIEGSHFQLLSAYTKDTLGFEAREGNADVGLDYRIETLADGQLDIDVDDFSLDLRDVVLWTHGRVADDGSDADREVLQLPGFHIDGGSLRFPEQEAAISSISIEDGVVSLYRKASGELNVVSEQPSADGDAEPPETTADPAASNPWAVTLGKLDVLRTEIGLIDDSVQPQADIGVRNLNISLAEISNEPGARFPTEISLETRGGGNVALSGETGVLPDVNADLEASVESIALAFLHPYIKSLADVNLDSGAFGMQAQLHVSPDEQFAVKGDMAVTEFLITETDQGTRLGSWDNIAAKQLTLSLSNETLDISEIQVDRAYGDILITEDGTINLGRVALGEQLIEEERAEPEEERVEEATEEQTAAAEEPLPLTVTIGRVVVNDAAADFEDRSLPLPFDVKIAELNGTLTTIASASAEPSEAALEGKVDEFGLVRVSGTMTPLQPALNTDLKVNFENVEMPKFSAYSVPFAGREIDSGKLDLFLGYRLENSALVGENKIILRDFELGKKVDHPGASSLPLGLAVALLKDADGTIDIDLPVRGNVDDPEFRYGRVIGKALVNLVVKIAASPFALLGKLVGVEADELEYIAFQDGRADLTPPEQEKAGKLAEALALRPELSIEIQGVIDREVDGLALRTAKLDALVDEQIDADIAEESDEASYAARRTEVLEVMYGEKDALQALRVQFETEDVFDELAYATELRRQLIAQQVVEEAELVALAQERAANIRTAILESNPGLEAQIGSGDLQAIEKGSDETINMKVVLSADEDDG